MTLSVLLYATFLLAGLALMVFFLALFTRAVIVREFDALRADLAAGPPATADVFPEEYSVEDPPPTPR